MVINVKKACGEFFTGFFAFSLLHKKTNSVYLR